MQLIQGDRSKIGRQNINNMFRNARPNANSVGLKPDDCRGSFKMSMGYGDAFALWLMLAFNDDLLIRQMLERA